MKVSPKQYATVLYDLTAGKSSADVQRSVADFARHMRKERKLKLSGKIIEQFGKIYNQKNGIVEAEVVTAEKLNEPFEKKIKHFVKEKYDAKEVIVKNIIDEKIKGGIVLKIGDEIIDGSIAGKLGELKKILSN